MALLNEQEVAPFSLQGNLEKFRDNLAEQIVKMADSCSRNVPRGLWRNSTGGEVNVIGYVGFYTGVRVGDLRTLGGDIAYAEAYDDLFKSTDRFLVTEDSLRNCGYELIEPETDDD
jgi:hypothetical protein